MGMLDILLIIIWMLGNAVALLTSWGPVAEAFEIIETAKN